MIFVDGETQRKYVSSLLSKLIRWPDVTENKNILESQHSDLLIEKKLTDWRAVDI